MAIHRKEEEIAQLAILLHQKELEADKNESYIEELQQQFDERRILHRAAGST